MSDLIQERYLNRYKELHKQKTGEDLDNQVALEHFNKLITLVRNTYKPIPASQKEVLENLISESQ